MSEKIEWEVVDAPAPQQARPQARPTLKLLLQALLGRWWRWKLFGIAVAVCLLLAVLISVAGVALLVVSVAGLLSFAISKFRQSLNPASAAQGGKLMQTDERWR
jgi:predicted lipid-binding transport protein (Tim44 family)